MNFLRNSLPVVLESLGIAVALLMTLVAAGGFWAADPVGAIALFALGLGMGTFLFGVGGIARSVADAAERTRQMQADLRALGKATLKILQDRDSETSSRTSP